MRIFAFIAIVFCVSFCAEAQDADLPSLTDSVRSAFTEEPRLIARLNTHNAFVTGRPIRTYGAKLGLSYGERVTVGLGYNWMRHGESVIRQTNGIDELRELRMAYVSFFFEYSFLYRKNWQIIIPVSCGVGRNRELLSETPSRTSVNSRAIVLYEPAMIAEYHFLRYFGIGAGVGFRLMIVSNREIPEQFTAPTWQLRFRVKLGQIRRDFEERMSN